MKEEDVQMRDPKRSPTAFKHPFAGTIVSYVSPLSSLKPSFGIKGLVRVDIEGQEEKVTKFSPSQSFPSVPPQEPRNV